MITATEENLYDILDLLEIKYIRYDHEAIYTIEEANKLDICILGQQCKNLFLRNRKGDVHYLVILDEEKQLDLKLLSKKIRSTSLSFASEERLYKYLGLKPGSVTPFGIINDIEKEVIILIDSSLASASIINFHPNVNTSTIGVSYIDFEKFIKWHGNKFQYIDMD